MKCAKRWSEYVVDSLAPHLLDEVIIKTGCVIPGCRTTIKGLKNIPKSRKISALSRTKGIEMRLVNSIDEVFGKVKEDETVKPFLELSVEELIGKEEELNQYGEDRRLAILNHFFVSPTIMEMEKEKLLLTFVTNKEEVETVVNSLEEVVTCKASLMPKEEELSQSVVLKGEGMSRRELKDYKILKHLYEELKCKKEEQDRKVVKLEKQLEELEKQHESQKKQYADELKRLKEQLRIKQEHLRETREQNVQLEAYVHKNRKPYLFIGTTFTKEKVQYVKNRKKEYDAIEIIYLTAQQWLEGPYKDQEEVSEVYGFDYDMEWHVKEKIQMAYGYKAKFFTKDYLFYEYVHQCWEV